MLKLIIGKCDKVNQHTHRATGTVVKIYLVPFKYKFKRLVYKLELQRVISESIQVSSQLTENES